MAALTIAILFSSQAYASGTNDLVQIIDPQTKSQLWINPGMVSYHFQQDKNFNNGLGLRSGASIQYRCICNG